MQTPNIVQQGRNCWRLARADRVRFLVDGADYFPAFRTAVEQARHSILMVGWDLDSTVRLVRDNGRNESPVEPPPLRLACALLRASRGGLADPTGAPTSGAGREKCVRKVRL
jgi:phosphatidylserine/phosphatidylglycerophosphate/cardiolipin synthase-like enzyme